MRKISGMQIVVFMSLLCVVIALAIATTLVCMGRLPLGDFRGVALCFAGAIFIYIYALLVYRLFLRLFPLRPGEIEPASQQEFVYHVYVLFYLLLFNPLILSGCVPVPLMRLFYLALGARLGENTYSPGILLDAPFITIGKNSTVGLLSVVIPHVIEGNRLAHYPVRIGDNVTIGACATVLSGATIGNDAVVATGAVVTKGTVIGDGETWAGVPARLIGRKESQIK